MKRKLDAAFGRCGIRFRAPDAFDPSSKAKYSNRGRNKARTLAQPLPSATPSNASAALHRGNGESATALRAVRVAWHYLPHAVSWQARTSHRAPKEALNLFMTQMPDPARFF